MRLKEAKMSTALKPTDPGSISSVLKLLPAVLGSFRNDLKNSLGNASFLRHDLELGEGAIGKNLIELADWATN
jgi:hypothetical protein